MRSLVYISTMSFLPTGADEAMEKLEIGVKERRWKIIV